MTNPDDALYVEDDVPLRDAAARACGVREATAFSAATGQASSGAFKSNVIAYDPAGRRTRHETFDRAGRVVRRCRYEAGKPTEDIAYDGSGEPDYRFEFTYDGELWTEKRMYSPPGRLHYRIGAERDSAGRLASAIYQDAAGEILRTDGYEYRDGLLIRVDMGAFGERVYEYDAARNLAGKSITRPGASAFGERYEFRHDARGLLIHAAHLHFDVMSFAYAFF